jgi:predicted ATP-dependent serine protease
VRYVCPACKQIQQVGGKCEQCGVDFAKYAMMLQFQMQSQAKQNRQRSKTRVSIIKQILLLPITGGLSLLGFLRSRLRGD